MFLDRLKLLAAFLLFSISSWSQATQTFSGSTGIIPDNQTWQMFPVTVSNLNHSPLDTTWGFERVTLNITHTWDADLEVWLVSPDGTQVLLFSGIGGDGDNFSNTAFRNSYTTPITSGSPPFTGSYKAMGDLGVFNNGQSGNGTWYLKIYDSYPQDQGNLLAWSVRFSTSPSVPYPPISSNLPIIKINTGNQSIPDDPKIAADFMIIDNGTGNRNHSDDTVYSYKGTIGIELRGSSSNWSSSPKKSYGLETWDAQYNTIDTSLLGMPAESDWILSASYYDKTLMRNVLSYHLANQSGHYAARTRYCELFVDGQYQGVYILMEKVKRDDERVDIAKLTTADTTGDALTGGYIVKIDKFTGSGGEGFYSVYSPANPTGDTIYYQFEYPKPDDIQPQQAAYIQRYVDSFETALFGPNFQDPIDGFRRYISEKSLMEYMFLNEMSKNVDGYRLSTFLHKDKQSKGGKLKIGPVWDYDIAWFNADYCAATSVNGWAYDLNYVCPGNGVPAWWERLRQDSLFNQHIHCRWKYLRETVFSFDSIFTYIDSTAAYLDESQQRNFTTWNIIGVGTWPEPNPLPQTYGEEIQRLKDWITTRFAWLDLQFDSLEHYDISVSLGNDTAFCSGNALQLYPGEHDAYVWSTGNISAVTYISQTGSYTVTVSDNFQCTGTDGVNIDVHPLPDATIQIVLEIDAAIQFSAVDTTGKTSLWYFGNGDSSTLANPFYNYYPYFGYFLVTHIVTDTLGCSATDTTTIYIYNVGISTTGADNIHVYPNPAKEQLIVSSGEPMEEIIIMDLVGNIVLKREVRNTKYEIITVSSIASGAYFLQLRTRDKTLLRKFVKE